jgi:hypothetical protein
MLFNLSQRLRIPFPPEQKTPGFIYVYIMPTLLWSLSLHISHCQTVNDNSSSFTGEMSTQHLHINHVISITFMGIFIQINLSYTVSFWMRYSEHILEQLALNCSKAYLFLSFNQSTFCLVTHLSFGHILKYKKWGGVCLTVTLYYAVIFGRGGR